MENVFKVANVKHVFKVADMETIFKVADKDEYVIASTQESGGMSRSDLTPPLALPSATREPSRRLARRV